MKKLFIVLLTLAFILTMSTVALATENLSFGGALSADDVFLEIGAEIKETHDSNFIRFDMGKDTDMIYVVVKDEAFEEYSARYTEQYGELVRVMRESEMGKDDIYLYTAEGGWVLNDGTQTKQNLWLMPTLLCTFVFAAAAVILFFNRSRPVPARQTVTGTVIETHTQPLSRAQAIHAVEAGVYSPSDKALENIQDALKR